MVYISSVFVNFLLASAALAVPSSRLEDRLARRRERVRQSQPLKRVEGPDGTSSIVDSDNWTGAVWEQDYGTFTSVTGTFTVPTPSGYSGDAAAIWVGIDGASCDNAILQTGINIEIDDSGEASYVAWYEWWPAYMIYFDDDDFTINAGDVIQATVTATSTTSGIAVIENLTSGQEVSQTISSSYALCEQNAEWIVEDFTEYGSLVPFADFGTVTFTDASASGPDGLYTPSGADTWILTQNDQYLSSVSISGSSVTITYDPTLRDGDLETFINVK